MHTARILVTFFADYGKAKLFLFFPGIENINIWEKSIKIFVWSDDLFSPRPTEWSIEKYRITQKI